eukprot:7144597-Pyramimonas_sp.AAC.1
MSILEGWMKSRPMSRPSVGLSTTLNTTRPAWPHSTSGAVTRSLLDLVLWLLENLVGEAHPCEDALVVVVPPPARDAEKAGGVDHAEAFVLGPIAADRDVHVRLVMNEPLRDTGLRGRRHGA